MPSSVINALRWILGLPIALGTAMVFSGVWVYLYGNMFYDYTVEHPQAKHIAEGAGITVSNFIIVFLSCWVIPSSKKYVGVGWIVFVVLSKCVFHPQDLHIGNSGDFIKMIVTFSGLLGGLMVSYMAFRNNGWNSKVFEEQESKTEA